MYKPESVLENETHKLFWYFEIQTDHLISARRLDLIIINKKRELTDYRGKLKKCVKRDKYLNLARELKILWNMKVTIKPIVIGALGTVTKRISTRSGGLGNYRTGGDHQNYCIIEIGENTEKSPGDLRRLVVIQTLVRNHQLMLVWKILKREIIIIIIINKKKENLKMCGLFCTGWQENKIERKWKEG